VTVHRITPLFAFPRHNSAREFNGFSVLHEYDVNRIKLDRLAVLVEKYDFADICKVAEVFWDVMLAVALGDLLNPPEAKPRHVLGLKRPHCELPDVLLV
jgi:hypothetical protein